jgi:hypothetical protein
VDPALLSTLLSTLAGLGSAACGLLCSAVFLIGFLLFAKRLMSGAAAAGAPGGGADAVARLYAEVLGYEDLGAPPGGTHKRRVVDGVEVHHQTFVEARGTGTAMEQRWWTPGPARLRVHVAERRLADGLQRGARDLAMGRSRSWSPAYPTPLPTGDAALDARFCVYGEDPDHALALAAPPLRAALLACAFVDLRAGDEAVVLEDPFQQGLLDRMGGPMGMARVLRPEGVEVQRRLHEEAAALLIAARRA